MSAKKTIKEIRDIVNLNLKGTSSGDLCRKYGVTEADINRYLKAHQGKNDPQSATSPERDKFISQDGNSKNTSTFYSQNIEHFRKAGSVYGDY